MSAPMKALACIIAAAILALFVMAYLGANLPAHAGDMPRFEQVTEPTACGQDPARPNYCGTAERICLSQQAFAVLIKQVHGKQLFMGDEASGSTLLIIMGDDMSIGVFTLEKSGRACLLASSADSGDWNKEIIKYLFLGDGRRTTM